MGPQSHPSLEARWRKLRSTRIIVLLHTFENYAFGTSEIGTLLLEHIRRHPETPGAIVLGVQEDLWLDTLRFLHAAGGTGTRTGPGKPIRWGERWIQLLVENGGVDNPDRDKALTRERATILETILVHGRWQGAAV